MASARPRRSPGAWALVAAALTGLVGACTSLWGIDDLDYDGRAAPTSTLSSGGAAGASSTSSSTSHSGEGGSGAGATTSSTTASGGASACDGCAACVLPKCEMAHCPDVAGLCEATQGCLPLAECMLACEPLDATCQTDCIDAAPAAAPLYHELFDCAACREEECGVPCAAYCGVGCGTESQSCEECINSPCVDDVCAAHWAVCSAKPDCLDLAACVVACPDQDCELACATTYVEGVESYNSLVRCAVCTRPACWAVCAEQGANCLGL